MEVQSLSVVVPTKGCVNNCKFCVSRLHDSSYPNLICPKKPGSLHRLVQEDYRQRLRFARDNGCNTLVLTGRGEPVQDMEFLRRLGSWNTDRFMLRPFRWIDLQTTGVMLDDETLDDLKYNVGVTTVALSMADPFDEGQNFTIQGTPAKLQFSYRDLFELLRERNFTIRVCLNVTRVLVEHRPVEVFRWLREFGVHQVTFRVLYASEGLDCAQNAWIRENGVSAEYLDHWVGQYIKHQEGRALERLPFGARRYSVHGISTVVDEDCMTPSTAREGIRYLILQPNCKLYTRWDDPGSILF